MPNQSMLGKRLRAEAKARKAKLKKELRTAPKPKKSIAEQLRGQSSLWRK